MGLRNWRREWQDREQWRAILEEGKVHPRTVMPEEESIQTFVDPEWLYVRRMGLTLNSHYFPYASH
jgi:hypothetical protein